MHEKFLAPYLAEDRYQEIWIKRDSNQITVSFPGNERDSFVLQRVGSYWKKKESSHVYMYDLHRNMTVWGEDTIHCVVLRKGDQLYMNILENPEVKGWLTEFYELSPDGYIKHGILFPSVFLEDFRKGLLNAQSIQVDSTDVISQPLNDYSDTVRYYWVLPTDEVLERYVRRDSFVFWTGTRATLKGFPFEEEQ